MHQISYYIKIKKIKKQTLQQKRLQDSGKQCRQMRNIKIRLRSHISRIKLEQNLCYDQTGFRIIYFKTIEKSLNKKKPEKNYM